MRSIILIVASLVASVCCGQIAVPEITPVGKIAELRCVTHVPDGERIKCKWHCYDPAVDLAPFDGGRKVHAVATKPGSYKIELSILGSTDSLDADDDELFVVGSKPAVPVEPEPTTLRTLIDSDEAAARLAGYYQDLALWPAKLTTTGSFRDTHLKSRPTDLKADRFYAEVDRRIDKILGSNDVGLEPFRDDLIACLAQVVLEIDSDIVPGPSLPTPDPDAVPGIPFAHAGFRVLFVHETGLQSPWFDMLTKTPRVVDYLNAKCVDGRAGWRVWDKDQDVSSAPVPLADLFRVPRADGNVLVVASRNKVNVIPLAKSTTADQLLAELQKYGG